MSGRLDVKLRFSILEFIPAALKIDESHGMRGARKTKMLRRASNDGVGGERLLVGRGISLIEIFVSHRRVIGTSIDSGSRS